MLHAHENVHAPTYLHFFLAVPTVALDRGTPMGEWCECRPVVRAAAEAAERRAKGEAVDEESRRAVRMTLAGLLPAC